VLMGRSPHQGVLGSVAQTRRQLQPPAGQGDRRLDPGFGRKNQLWWISTWSEGIPRIATAR